MRTPCDLLLTNAHVLTMDERFTVLRRRVVAVAGSVDPRGRRRSTLRYEAAPRRIDCRGRVVMPGLVNAHTHAPMTLLRGLADDLRLDVWLMGYMMPVEREFVRPDFVALGTRLACAEMIRSGIDLLRRHVLLRGGGRRGDGGSRPARALRADGAASSRRRTPPSFEDSLARARDFITRWKGHPLIVPGRRAARARTPARPRSFARAPSWPPSSTCRCTRTWRRRRSRSRSRGASTACRSCRG